MIRQRIKCWLFGHDFRQSLLTKELVCIECGRRMDIAPWAGG